MYTRTGWLGAPLHALGVQVAFRDGVLGRWIVDGNTVVDARPERAELMHAPADHQSRLAAPLIVVVA